MKRANALRLVAILAVLVLASMTAGCLKASITGKITPNPLILSKDAPIEGELTLTMTGWLAGGVYDKLDVEFFDGESTVPIAKIKDLDLPKNLISVASSVVSYNFEKDITDLVAPADLWDELSGVLKATYAVFTVKPGMGYGLSPIVIEVDVAEPLV